MRVFVIDDQFMMRKRLIEIIQSYPNKSFEIIEVKNERLFFSELDNFVINDTDIYFIDIDLKNYFTGIDLAQKIRKNNEYCFIIFVTNYEAKSIEVLNRQIFPLGFLSKAQETASFSLQIIDYLNQTTKIALERLNKERRVVVGDYEQEVILFEKDIFYLATAPGYKNSLILHHKDGELLIQGKLKDYKRQLTSPAFCCELKSFIINVAYIDKIINSEGVIQLHDGTILDIGKSGTKKVRSFLKELLLDGN